MWTHLNDCNAHIDILVSNAPPRSRHLIVREWNHWPCSAILQLKRVPRFKLDKFIHLSIFPWWIIHFLRDRICYPTLVCPNLASGLSTLRRSLRAKIVIHLLELCLLNLSPFQSVGILIHSWSSNSTTKQIKDWLMKYCAWH